MSTELRFFAFLALISFFSLPTLSFSNTYIDWWCNKTPYPGPCKHFLCNKPHHFSPNHKSDFRKLTIKLALERALLAHGNTKSLGPKCRNEREKAAWVDCLELYANVIEQLNKTIDPNTKCMDFDVQTWLSTALTSLDTCRTGFLELRVSNFVLPLMSNNVAFLHGFRLESGGCYRWGPPGRMPSWRRMGRGTSGPLRRLMPPIITSEPEDRALQHQPYLHHQRREQPKGTHGARESLPRPCHQLGECPSTCVVERRK
ncbi:pectin methylesterase family protein [Dorcoceras hygrometricum]|uniref:Pectin methylesterase family protein n=1 Tax=Dorcoceras hygrometricum TaxID=472368 RepID=A0A2Z7CZD5_9LAMI|nr:pectin methylesterase family protein [Dorcoceras hygrometricum]